jgi:taurine dioxygenase
MEGRIGNPHLATQDAEHPVVITHPDSGRKALYVNPGFTLRFAGWTTEESRPLLDMLYRHAQRPEFTCRFRWRNGSLAFWDNRATWHLAVNDYHGERREMHRITVDGCALA